MANKTIRGITIEIGGDTTKLGKALESTEKKSRSLQTELKEIEKSLKFDPTNVELLAQKQTVLTQNIEETSKKLDTLKEAERQVIAQFERGEVAEEQVRALQREIIKTEGVLGSMRTELNSTDQRMRDLADGTDSAERHTREYAESLDDAEKELSDFKDKAGETFDTLKTGATVIAGLATATGGYAVNLSTEFDKAYNTLQTQTGATAEEMDGLRQSMDNVYKNNFGESMEDVALSMATVKTQTQLTGQELEEVTQTALLMRDTFGFEVNESIRAVNSLMDQFGISAEEAYNLIAQGAQKGLNQNDDLLDTVNEYAVQFKNSGYNAEEMFNMLANGAEAGTWSIDKLGDAVKEYNIRMSDGTANEYLAQLGLNADEVTKKFGEGGSSAQEATQTIIEALKGVENEQDRYLIGQGIMGTMWEDLGEEAVYALLDTQGAISQTSDALDKINEVKYDDIGSALGGLKRTLETDVIDPLGEELKPVVEDAIDYVKDNGPAIKEVLTNIVTAIGNFVKMVVDNKDAIIGTIVAVGAGFVAWNVVTMIQGVVGAIKSFILVNQGATMAQTALNMVMKANPIGLIITAITALVAGFIYLWNTSDEFRNFWIGLWETIKSAVSIAIEAVVSFFSSAWTRIVEVWGLASEWFSGIWSAIMVTLEPLFEAIVGAFREGWELIKVIWDYVSPYFLGIWEAIKTVFSGAKETLGYFFSSAWELIQLIWSVAVDYFTTQWENIKLVFSVVPVFFSGMFSTAWEAIKAVWNAVVGYFTAIWETIKGVFSVVKSVLTGDFKGAWDGIKGIVKTWSSYFQSVWDSIKKVFGSVKSWFSSTFSSAWTAIKGVFSNWGSFFSGLWTKIKNTFSNIGTNISEAIGSSVRAGINGVISSIEGTINTGVNLINGAIGLINEIPGVSVGTLSGVSLPRLYRGGVLKKGQVGLLEGDGAEAVVPLEQETGWINRIAQKMNELQEVNGSAGSGALVSKMDEMIDTMKNLKQAIVLDTGVLVGETINQIDAGLSDNYTLRERRV